MALVKPTRVTKQQITHFKELYKKHYNIDLSNEEAREMSIEFLQFMTAIIENNDAFFHT